MLYVISPLWVSTCRLSCVFDEIRTRGELDPRELSVEDLPRVALIRSSFPRRTIHTVCIYGMVWGRYVHSLCTQIPHYVCMYVQVYRDTYVCIKARGCDLVLLVGVPNPRPKMAGLLEPLKGDPSCLPPGRTIA